MQEQNTNAKIGPENLKAWLEREAASKDSGAMRPTIDFAIMPGSLIDVENCDSSARLLNVLKSGLPDANISQEMKDYWNNVLEWALDVCEEARRQLI